MATGRSFLLLPLFLLTLSFSPTCLSNSEDDALLQLKRSFSPSSSLSSWFPNSSTCSAKWAGIYCTNNIVVGLHLSNMALSDNIDIDALLRLLALRSIGFVNFYAKHNIDRGSSVFLVSREKREDSITRTLFHMTALCSKLALQLG
ncbi:hypothetical protein K1719_015258 [Acacia pycnantha]|nr:hypothetical protein K1719_015258 [Acacia pycnantha]